MNKDTLRLDGVEIPVYSVNTLVVGSGAASLNAAVQIHRQGQTDITIATDFWGGGTSNNSGSDKQTYYKISLAGDMPDSPQDMARDLFNGGCMHGDIALCEALNSARAFMHLVEIGVPFPQDRFGAFVGYKTDHDPKQRGTSAGPLTSHQMFTCLAAEVEERAIPVLDRHEIVALLTDGTGQNKKIVGALALNRNSKDPNLPGFVLFNAVNVILGTGGPAGIYRASVYPESQIGSHGLALEIGAAAQNLTESQFGLGSIKFRWNLSGTYQQVIPRYVSTDLNGGDEQEFLNPFFPDMGKLASAIFLKGYQWPFDPRKVRKYGSSLIDILVFQETVRRGRRVFLDYTQNPGGGGILQDFAFDELDEEAYRYLERSSALQETPIKRLQIMNQPAVDLYLDHGIDITREYLEIAVSAQHNNGGLKGNLWWESNIKHLFPVGEVNGTHGVYRPGGSALNSGQVGSLRAAQYISRRYAVDPPCMEDFATLATSPVLEKLEWVKNILDTDKQDGVDLIQIREEIQARMSAFGAHIRDRKQVKDALADAWSLFRKVQTGMKITSSVDLPDAFKNIDLCLTHVLFLEALNEYLEKGGKSRGSYMVLDSGGEKSCPQLGDEWRFSNCTPEDSVSHKILEIRLNDSGEVQKEWVDVRPIPDEDVWFENVWNDYRKGETIK